MVTSNPFVIAEAGVNHNGSLSVALDLIDVAANARADAVKFQTFRADALATAQTPKARYQQRQTGSDEGQLEMLRRLQLDDAAYEQIAERCASKGVEFISTPFDVESVALLERHGVRRFKLASGELTNPILLRALAATQKPLILSTGMATMGDIEFALSVVASVWMKAPPTNRIEWSEAAAEAVAERVTILHCTSQYPAPPRSINLRVLETLQKAFGLRVGYSDHTTGSAIACAAVAMGATVIEKHFTLDRRMPGPDHAASLEPAELVDFVRSLHDVHAALGTGRKLPVSEELDTRRVARRSLVAAKKISKGEVLTADNLALKRPGTGIESRRYDEMLGSVARRDYLPDDLIDE